MKKVSLLYWSSQLQVFLTIGRISAFPSALGCLFQSFSLYSSNIFPILHKLISGGFILDMIIAMVSQWYDNYIIIK